MSSQKEEIDLGFAENFALSGAGNYICTPMTRTSPCPSVPSFLLSTAAVISKSVAAPIERIKMLVQNQRELMKQGYLDRPYNGLIDCAKVNFKNDGLASFWRGNFTNVL